MRPAHRVPSLPWCLGLVALLLAIPTPSFGQPGSACTNFDNGAPGGWTAVNTQPPTYPLTGGNPAGYISLRDDLYASNLSAPTNPCWATSPPGSAAASSASTST